MTEKNIFYITDFQINLSRSVVIAGEHETQVEPKVLQVLFLLAKHQNEVVSHKEIMAHVWHGTEVVPNALQRCIAILRKVLGDDAKAPTIIATHPRIGYRLLAKVHWQPLPDLPEIITSTTTNNSKQLKVGKKKFALTLVALMSLIIVVAIGMFWSNTLPNQYTKIHQITQTDSYESHAMFSPKAKYLVFNRDAGKCKSHLWAKHMKSGKESQLTSQPGSYGAMSFTGDGRELVFAAKKHCGKSSNSQVKQTSQQLCWNIATLDFSLALSAPQMPSFRHQCQADRLENPKSLSNHQYAFLQYNDGRYQLKHYDDLSKKLTSFYTSKELYIYHFDYDPLHKRFAVLSRDNNFNNVVEMLDENGQHLSSERIQLAQGMSQNQHFSANFEPQGQYLLATTNNRLYRINFNGQLQVVKTPENNLLSVVKHPQNNSLLAVKGKKDIDIGQISLDDQSVAKAIKPELNNQISALTGLARSAAQDRNAQYQPNGDLIAFISDRSGQDQLWLWRKSQGQGLASQLSFVSSSIHILNFSWSPDGKHLAWASDDGLAVADLNGEVAFFHTEKPLYSVLSWYTENQLLVRLNDPQPGGLYHLNLKKNKLTDFGINQVEAAWVHQNQLIYSNLDSEVFKRSLEIKNNQTERLDLLNGKALFIDKQFIYSVDPENLILNQYNLQGQLIKPIISLKAMAWKVSGLKDNQLLLSQFIAINHDIVLLE
jgi:DNA-binding winged helix-turn-helix (wHTH) protein/Tol biopolymer transport system component